MGRQVMLTWELPLNEVVMDFFDKLKSVSRGYASLDYDFKEFRAADLVKLDIMINGERVDALSLIVHRASAQSRGRDLAEKMRQFIPRQMFDVAVQAAIGSHIIALENINAGARTFWPCDGGTYSQEERWKSRRPVRKAAKVGTRLDPAVFVPRLLPGESSELSRSTSPSTTTDRTLPFCAGAAGGPPRACGCWTPLLRAPLRGSACGAGTGWPQLRARPCESRSRAARRMRWREIQQCSRKGPWCSSTRRAFSRSFGGGLLLRSFCWAFTIPSDR